MKLFPSIATALLALSGLAGAQFFNDFDQPPHDYWTVPMKDPMTRLLNEVAAGKKPPLSGLSERELLERLLKDLEISAASQVLVFSRTSLQRGVVSPKNPRAIYFNEDTYIGYIPGGRLEIASLDPKLGAVFYFQRALDKEEGKMFVRDKVCLECHAGSATNFLPGLLGRSVYPDSRGRSMKNVASFERVGHDIPMHDRWGGWYVTGGHPDLHHMGNVLAERGADGITIDREKFAGLEKLNDFFEADKYPLATSDMAALLVLDHQISMQFKLMEAHYQVRQAQSDKKPDFDKYLEKITTRVVDYLLFKTEAPLGGERLAGDKAFRQFFLSPKKVDTEGRSLRDLDLKDRMLTYRCSYMIHSNTFTGMPDVLKDAIYRRLIAVLKGDDAAEGYGYLPTDERAAIVEILRGTIPRFSELAG